KFSPYCCPGDGWSYEAKFYNNITVGAPLSFGLFYKNETFCTNKGYSSARIDFYGTSSNSFPNPPASLFNVYCYKSSGSGLTESDYEFGGMYISGTAINNLTGNYSCPAGFQSQSFILTLSGNRNVTSCYRNRTAEGYERWLFGGAYGRDARRKPSGDTTYYLPYFYNPATGNYSCPGGYSSVRLYYSRSDCSDESSLYYCLKDLGPPIVPPSCTDVDNDGYNATSGGVCGVVVDCNESNSAVHPNAVEICGNGIDEDCSGSDLTCPITPSASGANWTDMSGNVITSAQAGDSVRLFLGLGSGYSPGQTVNFMINATGSSGGGVIYNVSNPLVGVVNPNGLSATAIWKITNSDFTKTTSHNYIFSALGKTSGILSVSVIENDGAMSVEILNPLCGDRITKGQTRNILLNISDADDPISGVLKINNVLVGNINNLLSSINYTFNDSGNIKIALEGNNSRGFSKKYISNVMVVDEGVGVSGTYVAACIDKPKSNSLVNENPVRFIASGVLGVKAIVRSSAGVENSYNLPNSRFSLNWSFSDNYKYGVTNGSDVLSYNFTKAFLGAGENVVASLAVRFDDSSSSTIDRTFSLEGCKVGSRVGIPLNSCSGDGVYYCDSSGVARLTTEPNGACDSLGSGEGYCCPTGYSCDLVSGVRKCVARASSCSNYNGSQSACTSHSCFWLNTKCYNPTDPSLGCSSYGSNSSACVKDAFNFGRKGVGTGSCGTFTLDGKIILANSCKCAFSNDTHTCKFQYSAMDTFNSASGEFKCLKDFTTGECDANGKQAFSWTVSHEIISGSAPTQAELIAAKCTSDSVIKDCGQPVVRLPGFSFINIILVFMGLGAFYLLTRKNYKP
ncbi:MAG: MopE-related protein, partial [archaeon]